MLISLSIFFRNRAFIAKIRKNHKENDKHGLGRQRSAMHDDKGVFMIAGKGIRKGVRLQDFSLLDFAPTMLQASGLDVPSEFQGKVLDIFV